MDDDDFIKGLFISTVIILVLFLIVLSILSVILYH